LFGQFFEMGCDLTTGTTPVGIVVENDGQTRFGFVVLGSVGIFFAIVGLALDGTSCESWKSWKSWKKSKPKTKKQRKETN